LTTTLTLTGRMRISSKIVLLFFMQLHLLKKSDWQREWLFFFTYNFFRSVSIHAVSPSFFYLVKKNIHETTRPFRENPKQNCAFSLYTFTERKKWVISLDKIKLLSSLIESIVKRSRITIYFRFKKCKFQLLQFV